MSPGEYKELQRIADALERIARALETPSQPVPMPQYEPQPYWQHPFYQPPKVT